MFGQSPRHLGSYDSNSADSDIDEADRSQLVFCFFFSPVLVGKEWRVGASGCAVAKPRNPYQSNPLGLLKLPGLSTL
jgi:hypothetical protein